MSEKKTYEELEERIQELEKQLKGSENREYKSRLFSFDAFREEIRQNIIRRYKENKEKLDGKKISAEVERIFREASPDIEVTVRMININYGHNREILSACKPLGEYAWFIAQVRKNLAETQNGGITRVSDAIDKAIEDMPQDFDIRKFIVANRAEVKDMCLTEYNEAETMEMFREEGRQDGLQEAMLLNIRNLMSSTGWTAEKVMDLLKIPLNQRVTFKTELSKNI